MDVLTIVQGSTLDQAVRWGSSFFTYKSITAITQTAPVQITVPDHGLPEGWEVEIISVKGMVELNSSGKGKESDYHYATVIDTDTIELNDIDASLYTKYSSGGYVKFHTPVDLTGYAARMTIKDKEGGTELLRFKSTGASESEGSIEIDVENFAIYLQLTATQTAGIAWTKGICDLEMIKDDFVIKIMKKSVKVVSEITTD